MEGAGGGPLAVSSPFPSFSASSVSSVVNALVVRYPMTCRAMTVFWISVVPLVDLGDGAPSRVVALDREVLEG